MLSTLSWAFLNRMFANLAQLFIYLSLAKFLGPHEFGLLAIAMVFVNISNMFINAGFAAANVQALKLDNSHYSTVFYMSFLSSVVLFLLFWMIAPTLEHFMQMDEDFVVFFRTISIVVILSSINSMQLSNFQRNMNFSKVFWVSTVPTIVAGFISVYLAYTGAGIYALVVNVLLSRGLSIAVCGVFTGVFPRLEFNFQVVKTSLRFSSFTFLQGLADELHRLTFSLGVGRFFGASNLGVMNLARQIPMFATGTFNGVMASVLFPLASQYQNDRTIFLEIYRAYFKLSNFLMFVLLFSGLFVETSILSSFFGEQWSKLDLFFDYFLVILCFHHVFNFSVFVLNGWGLSKQGFYFTFLCRIIGILFLCIGFYLGIDYVLPLQIVYVIVSIVLVAIVNHYLLEYSYAKFFKDILGYFAIGLFCFLFVLNLDLNLVTNLLFKAFVNIALFIFLFTLLTIFLLDLKTTISKALAKDVNLRKKEVIE